MIWPDDFIDKVICGDCLEVMPLIPDKSINLIIADPPYNIGKDTWDKIPDYLEWTGQVFKACERVLKDNGSFYWFHNDFPVITKLTNWIEENTGLIFKQLIVWNKYYQGSKDEGFCKQRLSNWLNRNYYGAFTEYILFYTFQDETGLTTVKLDMNNFTSLRQYFKDYQEALGLSLSQINQHLGHRKAEHSFYWGSSQWDMPTPETYAELGNLSTNHGFPRREYEDLRREYEDLRREYEDLRREYEDLRYTFNNQQVMTNSFNTQGWNNNVWNYEIAPKQGHVTPKPIDLIENILLHSSTEDHIILDPFLGSGTTAVACKNLNRHFIGIEQEQKYCEIAEERLAQGVL